MDFLPTGDREVRDYAQVLQAFRALDTMFLDVHAQTGGGATPDELAAFASALEARMRDSGEFASIRGGFTAEDMTAFQRIFGSRPGLF